MPTTDRKPHIPSDTRGLEKLAEFGEAWLVQNAHLEQTGHREKLSERDKSSIQKAINYARQVHQWKSNQRPQAAKPVD
jgi:hypothetical protein